MTMTPNLSPLAAVGLTHRKVPPTPDPSPPQERVGGERLRLWLAVAINR
jgi:hypothetical protein